MVSVIVKPNHSIRALKPLFNLFIVSQKKTIVTVINWIALIFTGCILAIVLNKKKCFLLEAKLKIPNYGTFWMWKILCNCRMCLILILLGDKVMLCQWSFCWYDQPIAALYLLSIFLKTHLDIYSFLMFLQCCPLGLCHDVFHCNPRLYSVDRP